MITSEKGIQLIKHFEGCHLKPYLCPALLWTVGYGHVLYPEQNRLPLAQRKSYNLKIEHFRNWEQSEVDALLKQDLQRFERGVLRYITVPLKQNEFDALVSFSFNLGLGCFQRSTVRSAFIRGDKKRAGEVLLKYCYAGGRRLKGLIRRRIAEHALFMSKG